MASQYYIEHLLTILDHAKTKVPLSSSAWEHLLNNLLFEEMPLSMRLGIKKTLFPSVNHLTDTQVEQLVTKILEVWDIYNYEARYSLDEDVPLRKAYADLISVWDEPVPLVTVGRYHFIFSDFEDDSII